MEAASEEIRKIQLTGRSTFIVSLPKRWVVDMNLKAGDPLVVTRRSDSSLLLIPKLPRTGERSSVVGLIISPEDEPLKVIRKVVSLYLVGYNTISLTARGERLTDSQRDVIKSEIRKKLVGTEILADSPILITIQVLLGYPELSVESALRRMCTISSTMHKDAIEALRTLDHQLATDVINSDDEVDRFTLYVIRQLKSAVQNETILKEIGLENQRDCLGYRIIARSVESTADQAVTIARNILEIKNKPGPQLYDEIVEASLFAYNAFETATKALFKHDYALGDHAIEIFRRYQTLEAKMVKELLRFDMQADDLAMMRLILASIGRIAENASDIAEAVLNVNVDKIIAK